MFISNQTCCFNKRLLYCTLCLYAICCCHICEAICPSTCFCLWSGTVNCVGVGLNEIPVEIPSDTQMLMLGSNFINTVNEEYFRDVPSLHEIHLDRNIIYELPLKSFVLLNELRTLNLRHNRISSLPAEVFKGLEKLQRLDLRSNSISVIDPYSFRGLSHLQILDLYDNTLRQLPKQIFQGLVSLQNVDLGNSRLSAIPNNVFRGLGNLTSITLSENAYLSKLNSGMFVDVPLLKTLKLHGCPLRDITAAMFEGLPALQELHLQNTELHGTVPLGIFDNMPNLKTLRLDNNHLDSLHESVISSLESTGGQVHLQNNDWKCSCGLITVRARWPAGYTPRIIPSGINCQSPKRWDGLDLWSIPIQDLHSFCVRQMLNVDSTKLSIDHRGPLHLDCGLPKSSISKLDWITPEGYYISSTTTLLNGGFKRDSRYTLLSNGTLLIHQVKPGAYTCFVVEPSGESNNRGHRISFSEHNGDEELLGSPMTPPEDSDESSIAAVVLLPTAVIIAIFLVVSIAIAWIRCRSRKKDADGPSYDTPFPNHVKGTDPAYAYAYVSAPEGTKKRRDISAYAIGDLGGFDLLDDTDDDHLDNETSDKIEPLAHGYDQPTCKRPKSQSCRERSSKYPSAVAIPRPSNTIDRMVMAPRAESEIYVTPANHGAMNLIVQSRMGQSDPQMNIGIYGECQVVQNDSGLKRQLTSQSFNESRPKSNPYMELVA